MYVGAFANPGMTLRFAKFSLERLHLKGKVYFCISSFEAQDNLLDALKPARSPGGVPYEVAADEVVDAVLDFDDDLELEGAAGVSETDERALMCCNQQLQDFYRPSIVPGSLEKKCPYW